MNGLKTLHRVVDAIESYRTGNYNARLESAQVERETAQFYFVPRNSAITGWSPRIAKASMVRQGYSSTPEGAWAKYLADAEERAWKVKLQLEAAERAVAVAQASIAGYRAAESEAK